MINATKQTKEFPIMDEGAFPARIYQIIHIGTVAGFQGQMQNKARITFEFPTELAVFNTDKGEQPRVLSQEFTLSFHEKATLTKVINACDPKALKIGEDGLMEEYDIEKLLGKTCLVTVIHKESKGKTYANMGGWTVLPKGMTCPEAINPQKVLNYDNFDKEYFDTLPDFIKDTMKTTAEYKFNVLGETRTAEVRTIGNTGMEYPTDDLNADEIPF